MLVVNNPEYFARVAAFAAGWGHAHVQCLWERLWFLHTYGEGSKCGILPTLNYNEMRSIPDEWRASLHTQCALFQDSAPASFSFDIVRNGRNWINGGLIYHGNQNGWDSKQQYVDPLSVVIGEVQPWMIHT